MSRIRAELARRDNPIDSPSGLVAPEFHPLPAFDIRGHSLNHSSPLGTDSFASPAALLDRPSPAPFIPKKIFRLEELFAFRGDDFLPNAYRAILHREADAEGLAHYSERLRVGAKSRLRIVGEMHYSREGRAVGVQIPGLALRFALEMACCIPLLGSAFRVARAVLGLPKLALAVERMAEDRELQMRSDRQAVQTALSALEERISVRHVDAVQLLSAGLNTHASRLNEMSGQMSGLLRNIAQHVARQSTQLGTLRDLMVPRLMVIERVVEDVAGHAHQIQQLKDELATAARDIATGLALADTLRKQQTDELNALLLGKYESGRKVTAEQIASVAERLALATLAFEAEAKSLSDRQSEAERKHSDATALLRSQLDALAADSGRASRLDQLAAHATTLAEQLTTIDQRHAVSMDQMLSRLDTHATEAAAMLDDRWTQVAALQQRIDAITSDVQSQHAVAAAMQATIQSSSGAIPQLETTAGELAQGLRGLAQGLNENATAHASVANTTARAVKDVAQLKLALLDQERRLNLLLEEARKRLPAPMQQDQIAAIVAEADHTLDAFYVSFEDQFRGTRDDIKERVSVYLPYLREAKVGTQAAPIIDIGCGRGELLEVLKADGLVAKGIDQNRVMIQQCREMNLDVVEHDAIAHLQNMTANSLGAVTGIHIIEHIPFRRLIALFDATLHALRPGGVVIFETPNPENLIVGSCNFYYDPTHLNPLPPDLIRFVLEARGFVRVTVLRLHDNPLALESNSAASAFALQRLTCAQDYAVIGYKA